MKTVLIIYGISWLILLAIFLDSVVKKGISKNKEPWYLYALMIVFAPLIAVASPFLLFQMKNENKEAKIREENWEKRQEEEKQKKIAVRNLYRNAVSIGNNSVSGAFIKTAQTLHSDVEHENYSRILDILDKLSLPSGSSLCVVPGGHEGSGSNSHVSVCTNGNNDLNIWNHIQVEDSPMGAWQVYLLDSLWHSLPYFWHGGYAARSFIFSEDDFQKISFIQKEDSGLAKDLAGYGFNVAPEIIRHEGKYYVTCCYWSDWGGLIRELAVISIENGRVTDFYEDAKSATLYPYDCMIMF